MEPSRPVIIVDVEFRSAEHAASLVEFLDFEPHIASNDGELRALLQEWPQTAAVLVADDVNHQSLAFSLKTVGESGSKCSCFLLEGGGGRAPLPAKVAANLQGVIPAPTTYRELLGALQDADLFCRSRRDASDEPFTRLVKTLVGHSRDIHYVRELIKQVSNTEATVLILGESGTGKEVVARNIHNLSSRRSHPFVPVNCGAIPAELLESELFGHEKGAFTGAISARQGRFEIAEGGTLFLDEIGDMPANMQVKLLRVLQEHSFERVGSNKTIKSDVRIVAATHQDLEHLVSEGRFRMDLFYRLNVFPIEVPPLRNRVEDIPLLAQEFSNKLELAKRAPPLLSEGAMASLAKYSWPGNVRELFNLIERLAILFPRQLVKWSDLPEKFRPNQDFFAHQQVDMLDRPLDVSSMIGGEALLPSAGVDLKSHLADIECKLMTQALEQSDWVVARAAKLLNLRRTTLVEKMRKFEICRPDGATEF